MKFEMSVATFRVLLPRDMMIWKVTADVRICACIQTKIRPRKYFSRL